MKRVLLLALTMMCVAGAASAAGVGHLGLFADQAGTSCDVTDATYASFAIYVLQVDADAANTSQFRVILPAGLTAIKGAFEVPGTMLSLGTFEGGITITYVGCKSSFPLLIGTLNFVGLGTTPGCQRFIIAADPAVASGKVEIVDCSSVIHTVDYNLDAFLSTSGSCGCSVPVEQSNWSKIKALYQ